MAKVKRDKRYQLPKNRIVIPLILFSLVFIIACALISLSGDLIATYVTKLKALNEVENTARYARIYNVAEENELDRIFEAFSDSGYTVFVSDNNMNILKSNGKITAVLEMDENDDDDDDDDDDKKHRTFFELLPTSDLKSNEFGLFSDKYTDEVTEDFFLLPDKNNPFINVNDTRITPNILNILEGAFKNTISLNTRFEYWTAYYVRNSSQIIAFKTSFSFTYSDFTFYLLYDAVSYILTVLIFVLLVTNLIRTHASNRKMRNLVLRDNITVNRNWFWFAMKSKEILKKRKAGNFQILLKAGSEEEARTKLERIIKSLEAISTEHDFKFQAGVYMIPSNVRKNADIDLLYNNASAARMTLESTDDSGIAFFGDKLVEDEKWIDLVTEQQKDALEKEEFKVYYQPKYDPRTNEQLGAEALIRWVSDEMGFVPPGRFIPIFENSGFITEIDHYMLAHVARDQKKWLDEGRKCVPVSVNVSRAHFAEVNLADQIRDIIDQEGAPHELIEIELTESAFFDDQKLMLATITKLKEYGFLVSMDDFGSGYSSLNSLKDMPLNILKLDAGFFRGQKDNERAEIVVSEILHLAKKLNMTTVAEGVDEQHQVDFLAAEGCNMIQGYYYSKPMPKEEYEARMGMPAHVDKAVPDQVETSAPLKEDKTATEQAETAVPAEEDQAAPAPEETAVPTEDQAAQSGEDLTGLENPGENI